VYDIHIVLRNIPGALASLGGILGQNAVGLEGGGLFSVGDESHAHYLVEDGDKAFAVLRSAGYNVKHLRPALIRKLKQERPGELGEIAETLSRHGINIVVQYSDHNNRLILLTDNDALAGEVTEKWKATFE